MAHQHNGHTYQFSGVGLKKAPRRKNGPKGQRAPRKMYAMVRKDQVGTPMESMIKNNYDDLDNQYNALHSTPGDMEHTESSGFLRGTWDKVHDKGTKGHAIRAFIDKNGGSLKHAKRKLGELHTVSFGADPKAK